MTTQMIPFNFNNSPVRTVVDDRDLVWFMANDLTNALGYKNSRDALSKHVDPEDVAKRDTPTDSGIQAVNFVNESGMYSLILRSKKPEAKSFKRWVTAEFLPAIRKTGRYETPKPNTLTPAQQRHVQKLVSKLVNTQVGSSYHSIWGDIKDKFNVGSYKDIESSRYPELCRYLGSEPEQDNQSIENQMQQLNPEVFNNSGRQRYLVVIENGKMALVKNINNCSVVATDGFRALKKNMRIVAEQIRWLDGDIPDTALNTNLFGIEH